MIKKRIQPSDLLNSPAFSQAIEIGGATSYLLIGGQNGVDQAGRVVGQGNFYEQSKQALRNSAIGSDRCGLHHRGRCESVDLLRAGQRRPARLQGVSGGLRNAGYSADDYRRSGGGARNAGPLDRNRGARRKIARSTGIRVSLAARLAATRGCAPRHGAAPIRFSKF